jgi:hypothetical protein
MLRQPSADGRCVFTTRTWTIVALGALLIVGAGTGSLLISRGAKAPPKDTSPFPVGQAFTSTEWSKVTRALVARGFDGTSAQVLSGLRVEFTKQPLALVRATSTSRGVCFLPVRGVHPGAPVCSANGRLQTPLLVYGASDRWPSSRGTEIVGIAQHRIAGVSMLDRRGIPSGVALIPASGGLWSFAGGYGEAKLVIRARLASGRIAAQTTVP